MPYIEEKGRAVFDNLIDILASDCKTEGELNYIISKLCFLFLTRHLSFSYASMNKIIGALECAKMEFARQVVFPYEDRKKDLNGDVYFDEGYEEYKREGGEIGNGKDSSGVEEVAGGAEEIEGSEGEETKERKESEVREGNV